VSALDWNRAENRLERFLGVTSFGASSEAIDEIRDNERMYSGAKLITDVRLVFGPASEAEPVAILLVHTSKIRYLDAVETPGVFRVSMDSADLLALRGKIDRALAKIEGLKPALNRSNIPFLDVD
jgi:hypothetical protein